MPKINFESCGPKSNPKWCSHCQDRPNSHHTVIVSAYVYDCATESSKLVQAYVHNLCAQCASNMKNTILNIPPPPPLDLS